MKLWGLRETNIVRLGGERSILLSYGDMFNSPTTTASA